jgi:signal transduction histidine kinase/ActR/RegA family two-component response regulator
MDGSRRRILLIEDDVIDQKAFEWLIKEENLPYDYTIAGSASEAQSILDTEQFDVIVSDFNLGDGTALDIMNSAKDVPTIIVTGAGNEEIAVKAIKLGAYDYLVKDINRNYLKILPITVENAIKRERLEAILGEKQKNLEAIFDAVPVGMLLVDENMVANRVNDAVRQIFRKEYSQIINRPICTVLGCINSAFNGKDFCASPERDIACHTAYLQEANNPTCAECVFRESIVSALSTGQSIQKVEMQPTLRVGDEQITPWLCVSAEPVIIDGCKHVVIAIDDITDRKNAEEKLKETMEIKSQFISTVSHELRTPLGCMKEAIAIVSDGIAGQINDQQKKFLDIAKRNVDRLAVLVNDVLDFQRLEANKVRLNIQDNDITEVVGDAYQTMAPSAKQKAIDFSLELEERLPKARFDNAKIIQVLTNLISNAIKFTPGKGKVSISVRQQAEELVMRISDTGMGIPKQALPKIFDHFYRVQRPGKEIQGTGLGLAIVNKIVMMHGGRIEVESEVDKGTTFFVFLPLAGKPEPAVLPEKTDEALEETLVR